MDTRAERSHEKMVDSEEKTMLGAEQKEALFEWLSRVRHSGVLNANGLSSRGKPG